MDAQTTPRRAGNPSGPAPSSPYAVTRLKSFTGMEGLGFNASLVRDGRRVCDVIDEGNGGMMWFRFTSKGEEALYDAHVEAIKAATPDVKDQYGLSQKEGVCRDTVMAGMVDDLEERRRLRRMCGTKTVVQVGEDIGTGKYVVYKRPFDQGMSDFLNKKYAGQKVRIVNLEIGK